MKLNPAELSAIILDRDGVINVETGFYVKSIDEWQFLPDSAQAIARLSKTGYRVFVATNQAGIARGLYDDQILSDIHNLMVSGIEQAGGKIEAIHYCPHRDEDNCDCRKPKPGLLLQIAEQHGVDLSRTVMVGDSLRDLQAAIYAGSHAVLVGPKQVQLEQHFGALADQIPRYTDLPAFVDDLLSYTED